jgi:hypothetical protein
MTWEDDDDFVEWLDDEDLGTNEYPLEDEVLELMYRAWSAARDALDR